MRPLPSTRTARTSAPICGRKIRHDAVAQIESLATSHGRNADAARLIVTNANEYTAPEALHQNLIEHVARSLPVLLGQVDGTTTTYTQKPIVLHTANAHIETIDMPWTLELLNILIDPNLLYLLFLAGIIGIAWEVFHPGVILPGTLGGVCADAGAVRVLDRARSTWPASC